MIRESQHWTFKDPKLTGQCYTTFLAKLVDLKVVLMLYLVAHFYLFCVNNLKHSLPTIKMQAVVCPNEFTTLIWQWGFRQCLPFSWTILRGKY